MVEEVYRGSRIHEDVDFGVSNLYLCFRVVTRACVDSKKIFIVRFIEICFVVCGASNFPFRLWWRFAIFSKMFLTIMALLPSSWTRFHAIFMWKFTPTVATGLSLTIPVWSFTRNFFILLGVSVSRATGSCAVGSRRFPSVF